MLLSLMIFRSVTRKDDDFCRMIELSYLLKCEHLLIAYSLLFSIVKASSNAPIFNDQNLNPRNEP
jgi:hypothetical protein